MPQLSFGQVINVTGPNNGFQGSVSRFGERLITAREFIPYTASNNLYFGDPAIILPGVGNGGGAFTSVADAVANSAANIALIASAFAGMAVREVKTQLTYPAGQTPGIQQVGYYANQQIAEVLERGSGTVLLSVGAPQAGAQIYTRVVLNGAVPAGTVGDWETNPAATDLFSTTATTTEGSTAVTLGSGTNTKNGQTISGLGIAPGSYIVSGGGTTAVVLNNPATATFATLGTVVTLSNLVALPSTVARTGSLDSNNILEITIKNRNAA
jgi:hypothetical protein